MCGIVLGFHRQRVWRARQDATVSKAQQMARETALISFLILRASTIVGRVEAACPR